MIVDVVNNLLVIDLQQVIEFGLVFDEVFDVEFQVLVLLEVGKAREEVLVVLVVDQNQNDVRLRVDRD